MTICSSILCSECGKLYDESSRRPCVGKCNHLICLSCKNSLESSNCPICDQTDAFSETIYNHQTIEFISEFKKSLSDKDFERVANDIKNLSHGPCSQCNSETKKLRVCTQCTKTVEKGTDGYWKPIFHKNGPAVYMKVKNAGICANCAIDCHEEHKVVPLIKVQGMSICFEVATLKTLYRILFENWSNLREGSAKRLEMYKFISLSWKLLEQMEALEKPIYQLSGKIRTSNAMWIAQLKESYAEVNMHKKKVENIKKMEIFVHRQQLKTYMNLQCKCDRNKKYREDLEEVLSTFPDVSLSKEELDEIDEEIVSIVEGGEAELKKNSTQSYDPDQDPYYWKFQVIKQQEVLSRGNLIEIVERINNSYTGDHIESLFVILKGLENEKKGPVSLVAKNISLSDAPEAQTANQAFVTFVLENDKKDVEWLKAYYNDKLPTQMFHKYFPIYSKNETILRYNDEMADLVNKMKYPL